MTGLHYIQIERSLTWESERFLRTRALRTITTGQQEKPGHRSPKNPTDPCHPRSGRWAG